MKTKTNGNGSGWDETAIWDDLLLERRQDLFLEFPPDIDLMLTQYKIAVTEMPRQQTISRILDGSPFLEWLVAERPRQFASVALQYAFLPDDQRDEFISKLTDWWRLVRANEDRAIAHVAEHKRRGSAQ